MTATRHGSSLWTGLLLACAGVILASCTQTEPSAASTESSATQAQAALDSPDAFQTGADASLGPRESMPGAALYESNCAHCHTGQVPKAPHFIWLEMMSGHGLMKTMTDGIMQQQAAGLAQSDKVAVVEYLTRQRYEHGSAASATPQNLCTDPTINARAGAAASGWGHDNSRFVPASAGGLQASTLPRLKLQWAFGFPDSLRARSNPAIGYGAVFVGSQDGTVYALDLASGCVKWHFQASAEVRTGVVLTPSSHGSPPRLYFGDILAKAYALDALTGDLIWSRKMDDHASATLTGTPALHGDTLYVPVSSLEVTSAADPAYDCCTFRGKVTALNVADGSERWVAYAIPEAPAEVAKTSAGARVMAPSGAPVWASPTVDAEAGLLYFGTGENYSSPADGNSDAIIAVDLKTGARVWHWQATANDAWNVACMMQDNPNCPGEDGPDFDLGSSIIRMDLADGRARLIAGHKDGSLFALDPAAKGQPPLWTTRVGRGSIQGGVHFGMAAGEGRVYVPINDMNDTRNGDQLDPALARPGIHAVAADSGAILWQNVAKNTCGENRPFCDPGVSGAITAVPGAVIAGHLDGKLRAYEGASGDVLWEFDSARDFDTVNGVPARGGSISGGGAAVGNGYLAVNSGYGLYFHEPGNVLLVFAPE
ncbi:MAG: PQQ-binding-like beta-propeller repeat protein [Pseudomonadales bacterium]